MKHGFYGNMHFGSENPTCKKIFWNSVFFELECYILQNMWLKQNFCESSWLVWLSWLECCLYTERSWGSIPSQGTYLGCGFDPWLGRVREATN